MLQQEPPLEEDIQSFLYNKQVLFIESCKDVFNKSVKSRNDKYNKTRENIIGSIINNAVPPDFYKNAYWSELKDGIISFLAELSKEPFTKVECLHKGGRGNNYDFTFRINYADGLIPIEKHIEFKYGSVSIDKTPQFVSPMNPSKYLISQCSYEEYVYDKCLPILSEKSGLPIPLKEEYVKEIHSTSPPCMKEFQTLYYQGCKKSSKYTGTEEANGFYELCKKLSKESIQHFINESELDIELLSKYLYDTQKNKVYMLYSNKKFILENVDMDNYKLISTTKNPSKQRYECISENGKQVNILLRWKNGHCIAYPAFQIS
jgi:hypothetical protein